MKDQTFCQELQDEDRQPCVDIEISKDIPEEEGQEEEYRAHFEGVAEIQEFPIIFIFHQILFLVEFVLLVVIVIDVDSLRERVLVSEQKLSQV